MGFDLMSCEGLPGQPGNITAADSVLMNTVALIC
jgi:hypothetical protein